MIRQSRGTLGPKELALRALKEKKLDFTAHKHPCLAVACPDCKARAGAWCIRPSGHRAMNLHKARLQTADAVWEEGGFPAITQVGPEKFVYDAPKAPAPAKPEEKAMKTPKKKAKKKAKAKKTAARRAGKAPVSAKPKAKGKTPAATESASAPALRPGSKGEIMLNMALRPQGATEAEMCKELGWVRCRVTLRRTCEKVGATLTSEGKGEERVYKATMPQASPPTAPAAPA